VALSDEPVVETVTLRAPVASPMRMTGSVVMRTGSDSISGMGAGSSVVVVGQDGVVGAGSVVGVVARRGLVAGCCESCALSMRDGETRAQQSRVAANILWKEERIGLCAHVKREKKGGERAAAILQYFKRFRANKSVADGRRSVERTAAAKYLLTARASPALRRRGC
jgi:hypothetical protein